MADPERTPRRRRRVLLAVGVVLVLLAWIGGIVVSAYEVRHAPAPSHLDNALDGVDQPDAAKPPTTPAPTAATRWDAAASGPVEGPCWPVYGRTASRVSDGSSIDQGIPKTEVWQLRVGIMEFPPAFCDGVLYVNNQKGFTYAIDSKLRRTLWRRRTARLYDSTPAVSGSRIFVGSFSPPYVQALDRRTGALLWRLKAGGAVESSPVVVGGLVYATSKDHRVYALDERTGRVKWAFLTGAEVKDSPSVSGGLVYVADYRGQVFALRAHSGKVRWKHSYAGVRGDRIYTSVPVVGGRAFFATVRGNVYAVDGRTGHTKWHTSIPGYVYATPAIADGRMFIGNYPGRLYAFDVRTGRKLWSKSVGGSISGSPVVIGDVVYVSSLSKRRTIAYSVKNGRELWRHADGRYVPGIATDDGLYLSLGTTLTRWSSSRSEARAGGPPEVHYSMLKR